MPKRKRDIFTVIESINNWFEASNQDSHSYSAHEGVSSGHETTGDTLNQLTVNGWVAEGQEPGTNDGSATTLSHVAPSRLHSSEGVGRPSDLEEGDVAVLRNDHQLVTGTGKAGTSQGTPAANGTPERPIAGYRPNISDLGPSLIPVPTTGTTGVEEPTGRAFWQLLKDAGYDVWGL